MCDAGNTLASCGGDKQVRIWQRFEGNSGTGGAARWACAAVLEEGHNRTVRVLPDLLTSCGSCWSPSASAAGGELRAMAQRL